MGADAGVSVLVMKGSVPVAVAPGLAVPAGDLRGQFGLGSRCRFTECGTWHPRRFNPTTGAPTARFWKTMVRENRRWRSRTRCGWLGGEQRCANKEAGRALRQARPTGAHRVVAGEHLKHHNFRPQLPGTNPVQASFRFLIFRGKFTTHLLVEQDAATRTMRFSLKPGARGIMKAFVGVWQIEPHPMDPHACITHLDQVRGRRQGRAYLHLQLIRGSFALPCHAPPWQLITLSCVLFSKEIGKPWLQDVAIGVFLPPPLPRFLKAMTCNQVKRIFEDVQA